MFEGPGPWGAIWVQRSRFHIQYVLRCLERGRIRPAKLVVLWALLGHIFEWIGLILILLSIENIIEQPIAMLLDKGVCSKTQSSPSCPASLCSSFTVASQMFPTRAVEPPVVA